MAQKDWKFVEEQRDAVCKGLMCPSCLGPNVKSVGSVPDGFNLNQAFDCQDCGEQWEGY